MSYVSAAAVIQDPESTGYQKTSSTSSGATFNIDADRPASPDDIVTVTGNGRSGVSVAGVSREVLGVGDTVGVTTKLGNAANGVLLGDSLTVIMDLFGKTFLIEQDVSLCGYVDHHDYGHCWFIWRSQHVIYWNEH